MFLYKSFLFVYLHILENAIEPLILIILEDNADDYGNLEVTFQQDGASAHYYDLVRLYLDEEYHNRWFGGRGPMESPTWSPEHTTLDFRVWRYLESKVYTKV